jgi:hypothetical protein
MEPSKFIAEFTIVVSGMKNKMYRKYIFYNLVQNTCLYLKNYISSPIKANVKLLNMNGNSLMHKCKLNTAFIGSLN